MLLVFVLPGERVLALGLLPQNLKHRAVVDDIEAIIDGLNRHALAMDSHLVHEIFTLPTDIEQKKG